MYKPAPGYILVKPEKTNTSEKVGAFEVPEKDLRYSEGVVEVVSNGFVTVAGAQIECPVTTGQTICYVKKASPLMFGDLELIKYEEIFTVKE